MKDVRGEFRLMGCGETYSQKGTTDFRIKSTGISSLIQMN